MQGELKGDFRYHLDQQIKAAYMSSKNGWVYNLEEQVEVFDHQEILKNMDMKCSAGMALLKGMMIVVTPKNIFHFELN